ncbi:phosphoribosylaminoimidazole carboxylase [Boletus reticuloceps]|uniref:Phosphoribosylaminoimidazole carboxylase n=1 Tax=Boletus reticuloceps TaxID=495285 RepID=A0A8I2YPL1_9AGAM|nr:phosphoribosylaminoimidazole carboxylase [Boletus reticuloceps]
MLAASASLLNIDVVILDVGESAPAKQIIAPRLPALTHVDGSFADPEKIRQLACKVDVITVEIEHVDVTVLKEIESTPGTRAVIHPSPSTIAVIQDKFEQKTYLHTNGCPVSEFVKVEQTIESIKATAAQLGLPFMLKSRTLAYDGRGNFVVRTLDQAGDALQTLSNRPLYAERWVSFIKEIAVMVVRTTDGDVVSYPAVETVHKDNICHLVFAPLRSHDPLVASRAQRVAESAIQTLQGAGVFGVEMFLMQDGTIYINEIAPRPHNSGHYTIEACHASQYENHLRAILGLPLGSTTLKVPSAAMLNIIGSSTSMDPIQAFTTTALAIPGCTVHLYGKSECRRGRKMGHVTLVADTDADLRTRLRPLLSALPVPSTQAEIDTYAPTSPVPGSGRPSAHPIVGVIMGSDSDLPTLLPAARVLDRFHIPFELTIVSAHRTPDRLVSYARSARARGLRVIVAGAGGAAHLPGMVAAMTSVPVVGVPVKGSALDGVDSLHSIVQMPRGIPVATVAINGGMNAGLLAVRILGAGMPHLFTAMEEYLEGLEKEVLSKVDKLDEVGWEKYEVKR